MQSIKESLKNLLKKRPITLFLVFLVLLLGLIFWGNKMRAPKTSVQQQAQTEKEVSVFSFSETPRISVQAQVDKKGIVNLVAQKSGIVSSIYAVDGQSVYGGNTLVYISDNNQGANVSSVTLQIAERQNEATQENFDRQKKILDKEKQVIHNTAASTRADKFQEDIDEMQLSVNKENLESSQEVSELSLQQAQISESLSRVLAPQNGTVEKVFVQPGQFVSLGTPMALFRNNGLNIQVEAQVTADIAALISTEENSFIKIGENTIEVKPFYISREATSSFLYSVLFSVPQEYASSLTDGDFVSLSLALDKTISRDPFRPVVPLDAVQITQEKSFVFIYADGTARSQEVKLGQVLGQFVEVVSGLNENDQIILERTVFDGDRVVLHQ